MNIEQQVVSLNLAEKLKELGIKQESQFYYVNAKSIGDHIFEKEVCMITHVTQATGIGESFISAFGVAELGEMLPEYFYSCRMGNEPKNKWTADFHEASSIEVTWLEGNTEANVRAKMLIHLIENNLLGDEWRKKWLKG